MNAIHTGRVKDTSVLDEYSRLRIKKWQEVINPMSRKNFGLIWDPSMEKDREEFFAFTKTMESNKELAQTMARVSHSHRFTLMDLVHLLISHCHSRRTVCAKTSKTSSPRPAWVRCPLLPRKNPASRRDWARTIFL